MIKIDAYVQDIQGNRTGDRSELIAISASYNVDNIYNSITFRLPITEAKNYHIGQRLTISIGEAGEK